jgi:hypothetical protein
LSGFSSDEPDPGPGLDDEGPQSDDEANLKPSTMRGTEPMYGYLVAAELLVVAILNLTDTHGAGAPAHPEKLLSAVGILAAVAVAATIRFTRHRMVVGFVTIAAAFVVSLPKVPSSLSVVHVITIAIPLIYAFILTQRQNKARMAEIKQARAGGSAAGRAGGRAAGGSRSATPASRRERRRGGGEQPTGPKASSRYTPPKPKRPQRPTS